MKKPLISIIVPIYNSEPYLERCVDSIINQTYSNIEIILVNDGSTDGSSQICERYATIDERIKVVHKVNGGQSSARNLGLDVCSGDFIGFVDSDDWISDNMYASLLSHCENRKNIATIGIEEVNDSGEVFNRSVFAKQITSRENLICKILFRQDFGSVCSRLFPREIIINNRFDETKLNEDVLFMMSIMKNVESVSYVPIIGYFYYRREGSTSRCFGKAIHDMVGNSVEIRKQISAEFPTLLKEAEYYEIYQHMNFLLCCPSDYARDKDSLCGEAVRYIRKHLLAGLCNPCFTLKNKLKLIGVSLMPKVMSKLVEINHQKR